MLIDTGWAGFDGRDADRIVAAAKDAGVKRIDYVVITHYHRDHVGGVTQLVERIPVGTFVDHGPNLEDSDQTRNLYAEYQRVLDKGKSKHLVVKPEDTIPLAGVRVKVLAAGRAVRQPGTEPTELNSLCSSEPATEEDKTENSASVGMLITFGNFRLLDMGDLTKDERARTGLSAKPDWTRRPVHREPPRFESVELEGVCAGGTSAGGDHEQWSAQRGKCRGMADRA